MRAQRAITRTIDALLPCPCLDKPHERPDPPICCRQLAQQDGLEQRGAAAHCQVAGQTCKRSTQFSMAAASSAKARPPSRQHCSCLASFDWAVPVAAASSPVPSWPQGVAVMQHDAKQLAVLPLLASVNLRSGTRAFSIWSTQPSAILRPLSSAVAYCTMAGRTRGQAGEGARGHY